MARFGNEKMAHELVGCPSKFRVVGHDGEWVVQGWYVDNESGPGWDLVNAYASRATAQAHCDALNDDVRVRS